LVTHKTGRERKGKAWNDFLKKRNMVFQRDKFRCVKCKISEIGSVRKYGRILEVHHIDENPDNNKSNNLITLCMKCHMLIRYKKLDFYDKNQLQLTTWM